MPGQRQPLRVIEGNGRKHMTKREIFEREENEVKVKTPKYVRPPKWLPEELKKEFSDVSKELIALKIFSKLDRDALSAYLIARQQYLQTTALAQEAIAAGAVETAGKWSTMQAGYFKQARAAAGDLGLTISSRCRLVLPKKEEEPDDPLENLFKRKYG